VLDRVNNRYGLSIEYDDVVKWDIRLGPTSFKVEIAQAMKDPRYVLGMPVRKGAAEMLATLHDRWTVKILTVRPAKAMEWTREWLEKNELQYDELAKAEEERKGGHGTDALIDDYPPNLAEFLRGNASGYAILVDQPWNRSNRVIRVLEPWLDSWRHQTRVSRLLDIPAILV
jgi:5'(3')-deoxyribonucleotidase